MSTQKVLCLVGPTASGKTAIALELCDALQGEIISADSVQIYRGLNIGSAKPSADEQQRAPHHLINIREPNQNYSAAQWAHDAAQAIAEITARGKTPIVVGGTGFYLRALFQPEKISTAPPDEKLRAELNAEYSENAEKTFARLQQLNGEVAARIHPNDRYRVVRALEIALSQNEAPRVLSSRFSPQVFGLEWPRETLYRRIETRIDDMLQSGFMDELRVLIEGGAPPTSTALQSIGYKQMQPALSDEKLFEECVQTWKRDTRHYAKRQMTWFRHQLPTRWIEMNNLNAHQATQMILRAL